MTNTVINEAGVYVNADGLYVLYPPLGAADSVVGLSNFNGQDQEVLISIDSARLPAYTADEAHGRIYGSYPSVVIPAGALIKSAVLTVDTGFDSGGSATLSVGLVAYPTTAGVVAEIDNDGLIDAAAEADMDTAGKVITGAGALVNTVLATAGYVWVSVQAATFTVGHGRLKITYYMPNDELTSH